MGKRLAKIPEMGIILEFMGNPRNSSQGMLTRLMRAWNIFRFLFEGIIPRCAHIEHLKNCHCLISTAKNRQYCNTIRYKVKFTPRDTSFPPHCCVVWYLTLWCLIYVSPQASALVLPKPIQCMKCDGKQGVSAAFNRPPSKFCAYSKELHRKNPPDAQIHSLPCLGNPS